MLAEEYISFLEKSNIPYYLKRFYAECDFIVYEIDVAIKDNIIIGGGVENKSSLEKQEMIAKELSVKYPDIYFLGRFYGDLEMQKVMPLVGVEELHREVCRMKDIVDEVRRMLQE